MKRIIFILCLLIGISTSARKSYIHIVATEVKSTIAQTIYLTGDVPPGFSDYYLYYDNMTIGQLLNELADYGYELEFMEAPALSTTNTSSSSGNYMQMCYVVSKEVSSGGPITKAPTVNSDKGEAYIVARYDLQGLPVSEDTKGVQIIVYSDYSTETKIVE